MVVVIKNASLFLLAGSVIILLGAIVRSAVNFSLLLVISMMRVL